MSRLEINSERIREDLLARNKFNPNSIYDINNSIVVDSINEGIDILLPTNAFDFSNTVIGRVIGPNTPIAKIGNKALINLYTQQVRSTIVRKNLPKINMGNLFTGKELFEKNIDYTITKENSSNIQEKIFNALKDYSGINSSINPIPSNVTTSDLISKYTGKAQVDTLSSLLSQNIYYNNFGVLSVDNSKLLNGSEKERIDGIIPLKTKGIKATLLNKFNLIGDNNIYFNNFFSNKYESKVYATTSTTGDTINQQDINQQFGNPTTDFTWGINNTDVSNSKGLLGYTNAIFQTLNLENKATFNKTVSQITVNGKTYYNGNQYRSYNFNDQYDSISKSLRSTGNLRKNSAIQYSPIPKFIYKNNSENGTTNDVMFSIENLAIDSKNLLNPNEIGPNGGRIMWFIPSIETLTEDVTPDVTPIKILGRGEPIYTYANTDRKLTIAFEMMVDYVKELIDVRSYEEFQNKIYQNGLLNLTNKENTNLSILLNESTKLKREKELIEDRKKYINQNPEIVFNNLPITLYYYNNSSTVEITIPENSGFQNYLKSLFNKIQESLNEYEYQTFEIRTKSTVCDLLSQNENVNDLSDKRSNNFKSFLEMYIDLVYPNLLSKIKILIEKPLQNSLVELSTSDTIDFILSPTYKNSIITAVIATPFTEENFNKDIEAINQELQELNDRRTNENNNKVFTDLTDYSKNTTVNSTQNKILTKTIQNGLMSYTPEDLYKRLTFLHQCTRQGSTKIYTNTNQTSENNKISNSVFGRPPVIVFKLGDMYNTKAMITSMSLSFENDRHMWDLNPEGYGVQKMGCKVNLSMNLIGGSSMDGPKSHILNGESRRFYANSSYEAIESGSSADVLDNEEKA